MVAGFFQRLRGRDGQIVVVSMLFIVLLGGGLYLADNEKRLQGIHHLNQAVHAVLFATADEESAMRGYLVTGNQVFLDDYNNGFSQARAQLDELLRFMPSRLGGQFDAANLNRLVAARQASLAHTIDLRRNQGFEAAQIYMNSLEGKRQMDAIRKQVLDLDDAVDAEEKRLEERLSISLNLVVPLVALLLLLLIVLAIIQSWSIRRAMVIAMKAEAETERRNQQLAALSDMTDELHVAADRDETYRIIQHHGARLIAGLPVSLFFDDLSHDQLRRVAAWGDGVEGLSQQIFPSVDCWSIRKGKAHVNHPDRGVQCAHLIGRDAVALCLPLTAGGRTVGLLCVGDASLDALEDGGEIRRAVVTFGERVTLALVNLELRERLENQALRDKLTSLYNRRYLDEASERELKRAERYGAPLSILAIDIDHFKRINDQYSHAAGDEVLRRVSQHLVDSSRATDLVCRMGGDELLIMLPETDVAGAAEIAGQLRASVSQLRLGWHSGDLPPVTISIGVASYPAHAHAHKFSVLLSLADEALYQAKQDGRNCVRVWQSGALATA